MMHGKRTRFLFLIAVAAAFFAACSSQPRRAAESGPSLTGVQTETVQWASAPMLYEAVGTVRSVNTAILAAQLGGTVREIKVKDGDRVRRGQLLAVLDDRSAHAQVQGAEAGVSEAAQGEAEIDETLKAATAERQFAEATFNRYKALLAKNSLSRQEYDGAEARYQAALAHERALEARRQQIQSRHQQATSQQSTAETYLSYAHILSPLDGMVTVKSVDAGTVVMAGAPLLTVEDTSHYRLEASLPVEYVSGVKAGDQVAVTIEPGQCAGRVAGIVPAADAASHTFQVRIDLPGDCPCRSGEYGHAGFPIGESKSLAVSSSAVVEHGELQGVFVVASDGRLEFRLVKTGRTVGTRVEILSGLTTGERVAISPIDRLRDGARVEAQ